MASITFNKHFLKHTTFYIKKETNFIHKLPKIIQMQHKNPVSRQLGNQSSSKTETESERLAKDKASRDQMAQIAKNIDTTKPDAWKWTYRYRIWDLLEKHNYARQPRPVHHRIPNFDGAETAAQLLSKQDFFINANSIKINPDTPQKMCRYLTLTNKKKLYVPQPRLRTGFFSLLDPDEIDQSEYWSSVTSRGLKEFGKEMTLEDKFKVDLIIIGSVAVHPVTGARLGKGEGFAELEYGMLRHLKAITKDTLVITTVHDEQVIDDLPSDKLLEHDVPVDYIITPTRVIKTNPIKEKPNGILWHLLSPEKLEQIPVLQNLKSKIERREGAPLPSGPSEKLPPLALRSYGKKKRRKYNFFKRPKK